MGLAMKRSNRMRLAWVHRWVGARQWRGREQALLEWRTCAQTVLLLNMASERRESVQLE